jgi:hypothetical protein
MTVMNNMNVARIDALFRAIISRLIRPNPSKLVAWALEKFSLTKKGFMLTIPFLNYPVLLSLNQI